MQINQELCIGCQACIPFCTMAAIRAEDGGSVDIDFDECVECGVCQKMNVCPVDALVQNELEYPRTVRSTFSNPEKPHARTKRHGRGTEEMKTNDVTDRYRMGEIGLCIEMGRPGIGVRLRDVEKISTVMASLGLELEECNPLFDHVADVKTGKLHQAVLNEKVMSAIIEVKQAPDAVALVLDSLKQAAQGIDTVMTISVICRVDDNGEIPDYERLKRYGYISNGHAKVNLGLGRVSDPQEEVVS
jgi:NAD-dependent dihydropyrimidine dehydrogenase PreA subunit